MTRLSDLRDGDHFILRGPQRVYTREGSPEKYETYAPVTTTQILVTDGSFVSRIHKSAEVTPTVPETTAGQVWETACERWFITAAQDGSSYVMCSNEDHTDAGIIIEDWVERYPVRKLILDV